MQKKTFYAAGWNTKRDVLAADERRSTPMTKKW
jgi:hypothetical protein